MADGLKPVCLRRRKRGRRGYWQMLRGLRDGGYELEWLTVSRLLKLRLAETNLDNDNQGEHPRGSVVE